MFGQLFLMRMVLNGTKQVGTAQVNRGGWKSTTTSNCPQKSELVVTFNSNTLSDILVTVFPKANNEQPKNVQTCLKIHEKI